jgi:toxin ParE1/3/4
VTKVRFLPAAELELLRETAYYSKARAATGARFNEAVRQAVLRAVHMPQAGAPSFEETRTMRVRGFPFCVVYRASESELLVVAVAPHRKRPYYWASRIE